MSSLDALKNVLVGKEIAENDPNIFKHISTEFSGEQLELLEKKGIFPYEYLDSFSFKRFNETTLLQYEMFNNRLKDRNIKQEEYQHAKNVWNKFNMKTFCDYRDIYLKTGVLVLADIFKNFKKFCLSYNKLDPVHYYRTPGIAWDACLKMSIQKLELITNSDMYLFVERAKRGGMSFIDKLKQIISI